MLPPTSLSAAHSTTTTALVPARKRCLHGLHRSFQALEGTGNIHKNTLTFIACYSQEAPRPIVHNAETANINFIFCVSVQRPPLSPSVSSQLSSFPVLLALSMAHYKSGFNQSSLLFSLCSSSRRRKSLVKVPEAGTCSETHSRYSTKEGRTWRMAQLSMKPRAQA